MTRTDDTEPALMTAAELKPLLRLSRRRPVSCAICMTKESEGVVLLNRRMKPRRVLAQMRRDAKEIGVTLNLPTLRFGRATVDGASDSMKVTFTVNKLAPGAMRRALLEQLRPAGYQRCEIVVDEGLEDETEDGEDEGADDDDDDDGADPATPAESGPAPQAPRPSGGDAGRVAPVPPETVVLQRVLKGLVKEMVPVIAQEPGRKRALVDLATEGQKSLKEGDIPAAAHSILSLKSALHPGDAGGAPGQSRRK